MDDTTQPNLQPQQATPPHTATNELTHVTEEMYKKNLELAERNKTLSLLRKIDEIALGSVTDPKEIAQRVVDTIVSEGGSKDAVIFLTDRKNSCLVRLAQAQPEGVLRAESAYNKKYYAEFVPLVQTENLLVIAANERRRQSTKRLYDLILNSFTEKDASKIQEMVGIAEILIYPLIVRNELLGMLIVGSDEKDEVLSRYRQDLFDRLAATVGIALDNALLYHTMQEANEQLKQLDKLKDEFVSLASHELRTPMTAVKSYIWMLIENKMVQDPKGNEYLLHAHEATDRLINLVNDMLNVSRIESGRMIISLKPINIGDLISDVIAEVKPAAEKQGVAIENQTTPSLPNVLADANKIKEVFINLIGNAIKFTPQGGVIQVSAEQQNTMILAKVSDNGKGIHAEDMPKLFTKFGMIERNYSGKEPSQGTGLGLYICKSIIELHGGTISVASEGENKGTTFSFTLKVAPLAVSDAPTAEPIQESH